MARAVLQVLKPDLSIFTIGKTGAGKSSLVTDLIGPKALKSIPDEKRPRSASGMKNCTETAEMYEIEIDVHVNDDEGQSGKQKGKVCVYDTRGFSDIESTEKEYDKTVALMEKVCKGEENGIILICIEMHRRLDINAMETMGRVHRKLGDKIWKLAVIALTKADEYPEAEWLEGKLWYQRSVPILTDRFIAAVLHAKTYLKQVCTSDEHIGEEYHIGMLPKTFDDIPIVPTSKLSSRGAMSKMATVGYEKWFDELLTKCCARESGASFVQMNPDRTSRFHSHPPDYIMKDVDKEKYEEILEQVRSHYARTRAHRHQDGFLRYLAWKVYWKMWYSGRIDTYERFELMVEDAQR